MKRIILALLLSTGSCFAQEESNYPTKQKKVKMPVEHSYQIRLESIDSVQGTKDELFVKANEWIAVTFKSANAVIQLKDKEAGKLIAKGQMDIPIKAGIFKTDLNVQFTISIETRDGRYRFVISDFSTKSYESANRIFIHERPFTYDGREKGFNAVFSEDHWNDAVDRGREQAKELKNSLKAAMTALSKDW